MTMDRQTHRLVTEVLTVLERHGHHARDPEHTGQAVNVIAQLAGVYDGTRDLSVSTGRHAAAPPHSESRPEPDSDAFVLTGADISTVLAALDLAAEYKHDLAEVCADCFGQSCIACQHRLRDARAYYRLVDRIYNGPGPADRSQTEADRPSAAAGADPAADKEAGQ
jgi:hypothetical protein